MKLQSLTCLLVVLPEINELREGNVAEFNFLQSIGLVKANIDCLPIVLVRSAKNNVTIIDGVTSQ